MNWKHLLYIIPLTLIMGLIFGLWIFGNFMLEVDDFIDDSCETIMSAMNNVIDKDEDCAILIRGEIQTIKYNKQVEEANLKAMEKYGVKEEELPKVIIENKPPVVVIK